MFYVNQANYQVQEEEINSLFTRISEQLKHSSPFDYDKDGQFNRNEESVNKILMLLYQNVLQESNNQAAKALQQTIENYYHHYPFIDIVHELEALFEASFTPSDYAAIGYLNQEIFGNDSSKAWQLLLGDESKFKISSKINKVNQELVEMLKNHKSDYLIVQMHQKVEAKIKDYLPVLKIKWKEMPIKLPLLDKWLNDEINLDENNQFFQEFFGFSAFHEGLSLVAQVGNPNGGKQAYDSQVPEFVPLDSFKRALEDNFDQIFEKLKKAIDQEIVEQISAELKEFGKEKEIKISYERAREIEQNPDSFKITELYEEDWLEDVLKSKFNIDLSDELFQLTENKLPNVTSSKYDFAYNFNFNWSIKLQPDSSGYIEIVLRNNTFLVAENDYQAQILQELAEIDWEGRLTKLELNEKDFFPRHFNQIENVQDLQRAFQDQDRISIDEGSSQLTYTFKDFKRLTGITLNLDFIEELREYFSEIKKDPIFEIFLRFKENQKIEYQIKISFPDSGDKSLFEIPISQNFKYDIDIINETLQADLSYKNVTPLASFENAKEQANVPRWVINQFLNYQEVEAEIYQKLPYLDLEDDDSRFHINFTFASNGTSNQKINNIKWEIIDLEGHNLNREQNVNSRNKVVNLKSNIDQGIFSLYDFFVMPDSEIAKMPIGAKVSYQQFYDGVRKRDGSSWNNELVDETWTFEVVAAKDGEGTNLKISKELAYFDFTNQIQGRPIIYENSYLMPFLEKKDNNVSIDEVNKAINEANDFLKEHEEQIAALTPEQQLAIAVLAEQFFEKMWDLYDKGELTAEALEQLKSDFITAITNLIYEFIVDENQDILDQIAEGFGGKIPSDKLDWIIQNIEFIKELLDSGASIDDIVKIIQNDKILAEIDQNKNAWKDALDALIKIENNYKYTFFAVGVGLALTSLGAGGAAILVNKYNKSGKRLSKYNDNKNVKLKMSKAMPLVMIIIFLLAIAGSIFSFVYFFIDKGGF